MSHVRVDFRSQGWVVTCEALGEAFPQLSKEAGFSLLLAYLPSSLPFSCSVF